MNVDTFWHRAFIAALNRLSPEDASAEANLALEMAVGHWDSVRKNRGAYGRTWKPVDQFNVTELHLSTPGT